MTAATLHEVSGAGIAERYGLDAFDGLARDAVATVGRLTCPRNRIEANADALSLDELHARRREVVAELAPLEALHGNDGMFDAHRRALRGAIGHKIRERYTEYGFTKAPSVEAVEDRACADPDYIEVLNIGFRDRVRYHTLRNEKDTLTEQIRSREAEIRAYSAEIQLR